MKANPAALIHAGARLFQGGAPKELFRWNEILSQTGSPEKTFERVFKTSVEAFQASLEKL